MSDGFASADIETLRSAMTAAVDGQFFPDWEFPILMGMDRDTMRRVLLAWPRQTTDDATYVAAALNAVNNLLGYPHGRELELAETVPGGRRALLAVLAHISAAGA